MPPEGVDIQQVKSDLERWTMASINQLNLGPWMALETLIVHVCLEHVNHMSL